MLILFFPNAIMNLHLQRGPDKSIRFNGKSTLKSCTIDRRTSSQKKLNRSKATIKLTRCKIYLKGVLKKKHGVLLVIKYSFDEFRRIFVDEKTFIESKEPIIPKNREEN